MFRFRRKQTMDENRMKVLEMLQEGKITAEEAERLLGRLQQGGAADQGAPAQEQPEEAAEAGGAAERPVPDKPRFLRVVVDSASGDKVNIRVPMALIRTGIRMGALIPEHAREELDNKGVDLSALSQLDPEEMVEALAALTVDVDAANGETVRIFCE
jgi:hypothetical protein